MVKRTVRNIFLGGFAFVIGATGLGLLANSLYKMDRTSIELSLESEIEPGTVVKKKKLEGSYLNPVDSVNPAASLSPAKQAVKTPDRYNVTVKYSHGKVTLNDRGLYGKVNEGSQVNMEFKEAYNIRRTYKGELLEKKFYGYRVEKITPK